MKRILVQLVRTGEQIVKQSVLALDVVDEQSLGELVLAILKKESGQASPIERGMASLPNWGYLSCGAIILIRSTWAIMSSIVNLWCTRCVLAG